MQARSHRTVSVILGALLVGSLAGATPVFAADEEATPQPPPLRIRVWEQVKTPLRVFKPISNFFTKPSERPEQLRPLYISFAALQVLDVHSTKLALGNNAQAREINPIVGGGSTMGLLALKATAGVGIFYMSERLWKQNRKAAIWTMIGLNAGYGLMVAHNYRVASAGAAAR